jgi:hypothetical protein
VIHKIDLLRQRAIWALGVLLVAWMLQPVRAGAATLDWDSVTWTAGSLQNSYDVTGDGINDIRVTVSAIAGGTGSFQLTSPANSGGLLQGGTGGDTLVLAVNWTGTNTPLTVTIDFFNLGASNVSFKLVDIDRGNNTADEGYRDLISSIKARRTTGTYVGPTALTGSANNTATLNGTNSQVIGNSDVDNNNPGNAAGDATINFGTNLINQVSFVYGNGSGAPGNPGLQLIGIGDITFTPRVPEVHPAWAASIICLIPVALRWGRRRRE